MQALVYGQSLPTDGKSRKKGGRAPTWKEGRGRPGWEVPSAPGREGRGAPAGVIAGPKKCSECW